MSSERQDAVVGHKEDADEADLIAAIDAYAALVTELAA